MFEKEVVALTCASLLTPFKCAESFSGLQKQQAIDADGQEMFGSTLLDKYRVQERSLTRNGVREMSLEKCPVEIRLSTMIGFSKTSLFIAVASQIVASQFDR